VNALQWSGLALLVFLAAARILGRVPKSWQPPIEVAADVPLMAGSVLAGNRVGASVWAGLLAVDLWRWWNSGDGPKRRLRRLRARFRAVRRSAPVSARAVAR